MEQKKKAASSPEETAINLSSRLIMLRDPAIHYLFIPKCGCTFVKNTLWEIQKGKAHPDPLRIHDDDKNFERGCHPSMRPSDIALHEHSFVVLRNPIDRFLSLYFDKVVGLGREKYVPLAKTLVDRYRLCEHPVSVEEHRHNLLVLALWLKQNLKSGNDLPKEAHWTPQSYRRNIMRSFNLKVLLVEHLEIGLNILLGDIYPNIRRVTSGMERNKSIRPLKKSEVLTDEIRDVINEVYDRDKRLFRRAKHKWDQIINETAVQEAIPRFRDLE